MNVSIHAKKGFLYGVITYYDEANVKRHKWISTGLKERGNKKEAKKPQCREAAQKAKKRENPRRKARETRRPRYVEDLISHSANLLKYTRRQQAKSRRKGTKKTSKAKQAGWLPTPSR